MNRSLARITAKSYTALRELDQYHLDLKKRSARQENTNRYVVVGILTGEQIQQLKDSGYLVEILSDLTTSGQDRIREVSKVNRFAGTRTSGELRDVSLGGYMNSEEVESALEKVSSLHPDSSTIIDLPNRSWENRLSKAIRIRPGGTDSERIGILFTGSMHAREWGGSDICINFLTNLIDAYSTRSSLSYGNKLFGSDLIKNSLEKVDIFVFPDVNPDGKVHSQTHDNPNSNGDQSIWWRKNRNPAPVPNGDNPYHSTGVDINRNFDFLWNSGIGTVNSDGSASSETYRGDAPISEPETKNVQYLFETFTNIRYYIDVHSFGEMILYSWGDDKNQTEYPQQNFLNPDYDKIRGIPDDNAYGEFIQDSDDNHLKTLAESMSKAIFQTHGRKYNVQQSVGLYPTSATSDDYAFSRNILDQTRPKIYGFTIEFGGESSGFIPPYAEMKNVIKEVSAALTEFCVKVAESPRS